MDAYGVIKTIHVLSAAILFGTGLGTAFFFWRAHVPGHEEGRVEVARTTVLADWLFTAPAVVLQPITGAWMIIHAGLPWNELWLVATYVLYLIAGLCWLPVIVIQIRMKRMLQRAAVGDDFDDQLYGKLFRTWFLLGWPAFGGLIIVFFLMVLKPNW